jgi:hypothetical protein
MLALEERWHTARRVVMPPEPVRDAELQAWARGLEAHAAWLEGRRRGGRVGGQQCAALMRQAAAAEREAGEALVRTQLWPPGGTFRPVTRRTD